MKNKIVIAILMGIFSMLLSTTVHAKSDIFYINNNGIEMTEEQYNKLSKYFSDDIIQNMQYNQFEYEIEHEVKSFNYDEKYFVETTFFNKNSEKLYTISNEITKEEFDSFDYNKANNQKFYYPALRAVINDAGDPSYHETTAKSVGIGDVSFDHKNYRLFVQTNWKTNPIVKSFDVSAIRWTVNSNSTFTRDNDFYGVQMCKNSSNEQLIQSYGQDSNNAKVFSNGVGVSMNIFDACNSDLHTQLDIYGELSGSMKIYGTYQHAVANVTLAQSKSYTLSSSGLGGVLYYSNSTIRNKYDNMQGVYADVPHENNW